MMNVQEQIRRYEEIDAKVGKIKDEVQREQLELEYDKKNLKDKMDDLKSKGLTFDNISDLENVLNDLTNKLSDVLDATERKINEAHQ